MAMATPKDLGALDDLRFAAGCEIQIMLALEGEIKAAIDQYYRDELSPTLTDDSAGDVVIESAALQMSIKDEAAERSAVRLVERIMPEPAAEGATLSIRARGLSLPANSRDGMLKALRTVAHAPPSLIAR